MTTLTQLWQRSEQEIGLALTAIAALCLVSFTLFAAWLLWNVVLDVRDARRASRRATVHRIDVVRDRHIKRLGDAWHGGGPNHVS